MNRFARCIIFFTIMLSFIQVCHAEDDNSIRRGGARTATPEHKLEQEEKNKKERSKILDPVLYLGDFLSTTALSDNEKPLIDFKCFLPDDSIVYSDFNNNVYTLYRYYYPRQRRIKIGSIEDSTLGVYPMGKSNDNLYFSVYSGDDEDESTKKVTLYKAALLNNSLKSYGAKEDGLLGLLSYPLGDNIVSLEHVANKDESVDTFFYLHSTDSLKSKRFNEKRSYPNNQDGTSILAFYANGNYLYSFQRNYRNHTEEIKLIKYDSSLKEVKNYHLSGEILQFVSSNDIKQVVIENDYIYLLNSSNYSYVGKIENASIRPIWVNESGLVQAFNSNSQESKYQIYFLRRSNQLYFVNTETNEIQPVQVSLPDGMSICSVLTNSDKLFIDYYIQDKEGNIYPDKVCVYEISQLLKS